MMLQNNIFNTQESMLVLTLISPETRKYHQSDLIEMHQMRFEVFCQKMKWNLPSINGLEIDQFDHNCAYYLLYRPSESQPIHSSIRIIPTTSPNLTTDIFGNMIKQKKYVKSIPSRWEISRFAINPSFDAKKHYSEIRIGTSMISLGLLEFGLGKNISEYITISMPHIERVLRMLGWPLHRIGEETTVDNTIAIPGYLEVSQDNLEILKNKVSANYEPLLIAS